MFSIGQHFLKNYIGELWGSGAGDSFNVGINLRLLSHQKHCVLYLGKQYPSVSGDPLSHLEDEPECFLQFPPSLNVLPIIFLPSPHHFKKSTLLGYNLHTLTFILSVQFDGFEQFYTDL